MFIYQLALKSILHRKLSFILSIASIALSVILIFGVERIRNQVHESFSNTISGTDLIVGARTGNVSLLLSSVFHIGYASQNVSYKTFKEISGYPQVAWSIPLSLGDSHKGHPVLGTHEDYFTHFQYGNKQSLQALKGQLCLHHMGAVLGSKVAKELGYQVGDEIIVTHGMGEVSLVEHDQDPFTVSAILVPTGTPVDQTIHVSIDAMGAIHQHFYNTGSEDKNDPLASVISNLEDTEITCNHHNHTCNHRHYHHNEIEDNDSPKSLTAFMLGLNNRTEILSLQRSLNTYKDEPLTAIMPVVTLHELWRVVKPIEKALLLISFLVLIVTFAGMLTTIKSGLNERRREMAILRSVGAKPKLIFRLILLETVAITFIGIIVGITILTIVLLITKPIIADQLGIIIDIQAFTFSELLMLVLILFGGVLMGIWPAYQSYKKSLADGLMVKH
jgi:putative ABC transport system permease protein